MDFKSTIKQAAEIAARRTGSTYSNAREIAARMAVAADDEGIAYDVEMLADVTADLIIDDE